MAGSSNSQQIKYAVSIAVLTEKLDTFINNEQDRHAKLQVFLEQLEKKIDNYFKIEISENGNTREYDLKGIVLDHERRLNEDKKRLEDLDQDQAITHFVEAHPRITAALVVLVLLGMYFVGKVDLLKGLITFIAKL